jgi:hypothetical protein
MIFTRRHREKIVSIQKVVRGNFIRKNRLPNIMYQMKNYLKKMDIQFSKASNDGRINSCLDETIVLDLLSKEFKNNIKIPNIRMWYDVLVYDKKHKWIPVNIKTTTMNTHDNTGNLAMCVYAYTDHNIDINMQCNNGNMSKILYDNLKEKKYNMQSKKDYYFLVLNKTDNSDIIINSLKGLNKLTPNSNNLPFQVCWNKNRNYIYKNIDNCVNLFIESLKKPKTNWKETFMNNIRSL